MQEISKDTIQNIYKEIHDAVLGSPVLTDFKHAEITLEWVLKLKPDADQCLQIAAYGHDIDRGITKLTSKTDPNNYDKDREEHSLRSAKFIGDILEKYNLEKDCVDKIKWLVEKHEVGGDEESDILMDADSIAYFAYNIPAFYERCGEEKSKFKIQYMFSRSSKRAQEIIKGLKYEDLFIQNLVSEVLSKI